VPSIFGKILIYFSLYQHWVTRLHKNENIKIGQETKSQEKKIYKKRNLG
jgi:hypothetical protein